MTPGTHALDELIVYAAFALEKGEDLLTQAFLQYFRQDRTFLFRAPVLPFPRPFLVFAIKHRMDRIHINPQLPPFVALEHFTNYPVTIFVVNL